VHRMLAIDGLVVDRVELATTAKSQFPALTPTSGPRLNERISGISLGSPRRAAVTSSKACAASIASRGRLSRKTLFEDRQPPARTISRIAGDLTKFLFAQLNLV